jgi:hypothetical protein
MAQPTERKPQRPEDVVNIVYGIATIYSGCFTPVLRSGFGSRAFASYPASLILMIAYGGFANCQEIGLYIPVWLVMVVVRRLTADKRQHSRAQGYPWLCRRIPFVRNEYQARVIEPWVCFFAGIFLMSLSPALGNFVAAGCVPLLAVLMTEVAALQARKQAMEDAQKEAATMMDLQRGGSGWGD